MRLRHVAEKDRSAREVWDRIALPVPHRHSMTLKPGASVACGIQWVLQARWGRQWRGVWFARTKQGLLRGADQYASHPALVALPDKFEPRRGGAR